MHIRLGLLITELCLCTSAALGNTNLSVWAFPGSSGRLLYQPDALGNRLIDSSGIGYMGGGVSLPASNTVPVKVTISPVGGDNVANLQNAIATVSALPLDTNGFRGAVLLQAGTYPLSKTVTISASGVVLRGVSSATNGSGTVLEATATNQYTLIEFQGSSSSSSGTSHNITNNYVPAGARSFYVDNVSSLGVGSSVYVRRVATSNWIHDLGMDLLGPPPGVTWTPSGYNIDMERVITHMESNHVFVDAPITCAIDSHYTNGTIRTASWSGRISNVGIEHIFAKSDSFGGNTNETHGWTFVQFDHVVNGWARDVNSQFFGYSCVSINSGDKFITVQDCQCLDPVSIITGGRRYAFVINDAQYCLFKNCYTRQDRHQFVTQSLTIGPTVYVDGVSDSAHAEAGPHQRWATAITWDNITVHGNNLDAQNAGNYGTGHGWEGANCAIWNCAANGFIVQNPPRARNWLIGSVGPIQNGTAYVGPHDPGTYDSSGSGATNVFPDSLYFAQLQDRLAAPNLQSRDYWLGAIAAFTNAPSGVAVPVDPAWRSAVQAVAGSQPLDAFDIVDSNHWVPFTFNFVLSPTEHVVAATLSMSLLAARSASSNVLYLDSMTNSYTFSNLAWLPVSTAVTNPTVRVLDLGNQLTLLTNGQLNVAAQGDIGIDWAMLELQVAPNDNSTPTVLTSVADATVRGGTNASINYGTAPTLTVRLDSSANNTQQAYLRWDLTSVAGKVTHARVRLSPVGVGSNGIEQGVAVSSSDGWSETGMNWNNQPGGGERFATWIPATNGPVSFDVTPQTLDALTGDKQLSLQLFSLRNLGSAGSVDYASREYSDTNSRPQLLVWVAPSAPSISTLTNITVPVSGSTGPIPFVVGDAESAASTLVVSGNSSDLDLVPNANIVFGGSDSNRTVMVTPVANQVGSALITVTVTDPGGSSSSSSFTLTVENHPPGVFVWNGPGAGANNWSTAGDWSPTGPPDIFDDVKFFDPGTSGVSVSNINNVIDASFYGAVDSLQYGNTNGNHTTLISPGVTLDVTGPNGLVVGTESDNGIAQTVYATITGPGGSLSLDDPSANLIVRQGTANSGGSQRATLDMSGLGEFDATVNQILLGVVGPANRATGTLYLGKTNNVTITGSPGILAGDNNSNNGGQDYLYLGQTNGIFVDSLTIARQKATATLRFNNGLVNPAAYFRASDGSSRVSQWNIADNSLQSTSSSSCNGTNDFSGGTIDALVDTMIVGESQKTTGANTTGTLTITGGTIDVNTLQIGFQAQSGAISAGMGHVNVKGTNALLLVNNTLELGHTSGGAGETNTFGTLAISSGATVSANTIVVGAGSASNVISVAAGTLALGSTAGDAPAPVNYLALTNSTLSLSPAFGTTNVTAESLVTGGSSNAIAIASLPPIGAFPAQFLLVAYNGSVAGAGYNFVLQPLPAGIYCGGYLSNNVANSSIDLVITNCITPDPFLTWDGSASGDWDTETPNWKNNVASGLIYADGNAVVFNDTASGSTTVSLTDTFAPGNVTVSNSARTYTFFGPGDITGGAALTKLGFGTLVIATGGTNDFTGGVTITGGAMQVGNGSTNGNLPSGPIANNGSLIFNRSDNLALSNAISGSGSLTQNGASLLLSASNSYTGPTMILGGTLGLPGGGSISKSASISLTAGTTLDASGRTNATLTLASNQTLKGNGILIGNVVIGAGATIAPGLSVGSLSVTNGRLTLAGTTMMELDAGTGTNDQLLASNIVCGGTLTVTNLSGTLAQGQSFKLFNTPSLTGQFSQTNLPTLPAGLYWTNVLVGGTITVAGPVALQPPLIQSITINGSQLIIRGTNNSGPGGTWHLLGSTNFVLPPGSWALVTNGSFDSNGNFAITNTVGSGLLQQFFVLRVP